MFLVDLRSANHLKKSATPATNDCENALIMPYSCHYIDLILLEIDVCTFSFHPLQT